RVLGPVLPHQPDRPLAQFRRVPCDFLHGSILSKGGASTLPRAVHRVAPGQFKSKSHLALMSDGEACFWDAPYRRRIRNLLSDFKRAFPESLRNYRLADLLYSDYRNASIHGLNVETDWPAFYSNGNICWRPFIRPDICTHFGVVFTAGFLCRLLSNIL